MRTRLISILRFLFRRQKVERDLDAELRYHVDRQTELNVARGMSPRGSAARSYLERGQRRSAQGRLPRSANRPLHRNALAGSSLRDARPAQESGVFARRYPDPGAGNRREYGDFQPGLRSSAAPASLSKRRPTGGAASTEYQGRNPEHSFFRERTERLRPAESHLEGIVEHHTMVFLLSDASTAERVQTAVVSGNFFDVLGVKPLLGKNLCRCRRPDGRRSRDRAELQVIGSSTAAEIPPSSARFSR